MQARCHVVLLGDSIFDNAAYVNGGPDVAASLRERLDEQDRVTLLAIDGSVTGDVTEQLDRLPTDATHVIVSAGGNDLLHHVAVLGDAVENLGDALLRLASMRAPFARAHSVMTEALASLNLPVAVCTIYDANFEPPQDLMVSTALGVFNDAITRNVHRAGLDLLDLRLVCDDRGDYANPIEPSVQGGGKIAEALLRYVAGVDQRTPSTRIFL
ncbi:SGNH/GDSL hydrolase family protein [Novosphingobium naphthalenivorans]|uniref:SGNH/GDSL hydrolase family protein n=1 Tax=Novosphingobium naphthalenivorans TaxID=273168 RepID=UPI00083008BC|nr:SGNH/GDSL hydrolase family protein [Novosphingobium naphthalenivorans]